MKDFCAQFSEPPKMEGSPWAGHGDLPLELRWLPEIHVRSRHVLFDGLKAKTFGDLLSLDAQTVLAVKNSGVKTVKEIIALRDKVFSAGPSEFEAQKAAEEEIETMSGGVASAMPLPAKTLWALSTWTRKRLLKAFPHPTVGDVCGLDEAKIRSWPRAGKQVVAELMALRKHFVSGEPLADEPKAETRASDFASLAEMLVGLEGSGKPSFEHVMRRYMGLLNVDAKCTLEACGKEMHITHQRVRQISGKAAKQLFAYPLKRPVEDLEDVVRNTFESHKRLIRVTEMLDVVERAFGWKGTTAFSLRRVLEELKWEIVDLAEGDCWGWNEDGRFSPLVNHIPLTLTQKRRQAIMKVMTKAGYAGMTIDEIQSSCAAHFPELKMKTGNVRGAMNGALDGKDTRIIPYERGVIGGGKSTYSLNTFFRDEATKKVLERAASDIKAHMEKTGLGVVSVWKAWRKYRAQLPLPLPKMGFYMMMRDFGAGGLVYREYPRIAYPGIKVAKNTFPWEAYGYFSKCRHHKATYDELMYFFVECLGLQPSVAMACAFTSMGLKKATDDSQSPYIIRPPAERVSMPRLFLPTIREHLDFSLVKVSGKLPINTYYLDEDGKALTHGAYAKLFFLALQEKKFAFPEFVLAGLLDKQWCKTHFKAYRPVLRPTNGEKICSKFGYWRTHFTFGGKEYFVSDDWEPRNKALLDRWATRISELAGIPFTPYEVKGIASTAKNLESET